MRARAARAARARARRRARARARAREARAIHRFLPRAGVLNHAHACQNPSLAAAIGCSRTDTYQRLCRLKTV